MRVLAYGDTAVLVEPAERGEVLALCDAVAGAVGIVDVVPAARTLLVEFDPRCTGVERIEALLHGARRGVRASVGAELVQLAVTYDGPDLGAVADELGISTGELVQRHSAPDYVVAFCGFAPGFAYLSGLDPVLHVPRLARPRTSVPAGSVGIAGEFTGVYPTASPGGWRLLASTSAPLWDTGRRPPALLTPATIVRFVPT